MRHFPYVIHVQKALTEILGIDWFSTYLPRAEIS